MPISPISPALPATPALPPGKPIDAYILIHQLTYLFTTFLATVKRIHIEPRSRSILLKTLMFRYSSGANILVACARELVFKYTSGINLGQPSSSSPTGTTTPTSTWNLSASFPGFAQVLSVTHSNPEALFGKHFALRFDAQEKLRQEEQNKKENVEGIPFRCAPAQLGLSCSEDQRISSALSAQYTTWNNAIDNFNKNFNPLTPFDAVELMASTALTLRTAALAVIKLIEHDLRISLGLRPIVGTLEAKLVYLAIVNEAGGKEKVEARIRRELWKVCKNGERRWDWLVNQALE